MPGLDFLGPAGAIVGGVASLGKAIFGTSQSRAAKKINPVWSQYQSSPYASQGLATSLNAYLDPSMGTRPQAERGIQASGANFDSKVTNSATDSATALALEAAGQGQTDNSISNYNLDTLKNKTGLLNNLNQAYGTMINEGTKEYQSKLQKYQMDMAQKMQLQNAGSQNTFGGLGDLSSLGILGGQLWGANAGSGANKTRQQSTSYPGTMGNMGWNPGWNPQNRNDYFTP